MPGQAHVLVVDDDERFRTNLVKLLGMHGLQATAAVGGQEALEIMRAGGVDIVQLRHKPGGVPLDPVDELEALEILRERHEGERDVTAITQDAVLATFDRILRTLTLAVGGIAAISLAVAGILVMNVMLVAVTQRTGEIGLLKALGAPGRTIRAVFLTEAAMLSAVGAGVGYGLGLVGAFGIRLAFPVFPAYPPDWAVIAGLGTALTTGLVFGVMPARRAARMDPVQALMKH